MITPQNNADRLMMSALPAGLRHQLTPESFQPIQGHYKGPPIDMNGTMTSVPGGTLDSRKILAFAADGSNAMPGGFSAVPGAPGASMKTVTQFNPNSQDIGYGGMLAAGLAAYLSGNPAPLLAGSQNRQAPSQLISDGMIRPQMPQMNPLLQQMLMKQSLLARLLQQRMAQQRGPMMRIM